MTPEQPAVLPGSLAALRSEAQWLAAKYPDVSDMFLSIPDMADAMGAEIIRLHAAAREAALQSLASEGQWQERVEKLEAEVAAQREYKDAAYLERNKLVALLAAIYPSGIKRTAIEGWSEDWHGCVYIDFPWGQASWHYHDSQADLFAHLPPYQHEWDGHTTEDKYEDIVRVSKEMTAALRAAPEKEEWPKEDLGDGRMVNIDPETLAKDLLNEDQCMGEAMDMVNGPNDPRMLPWERQPQSVKDHWIAKVYERFAIPAPDAAARLAQALELPQIKRVVEAATDLLLDLDNDAETLGEPNEDLMCERLRIALAALNGGP